MKVIIGATQKLAAATVVSPSQRAGGKRFRY
jgi:hypothetical protein